MDHISAFKTAFTAQKHASADAARKWIAASKLTPEFALAWLINSGAVVVALNGSIQPNDSPPPEKPTWSEKWAPRDVLIDLLREPTAFRKLQVRLSERGAVNGHWYTVSALRALAASGEVEKVSGLYQLTDRMKDAGPSAPLSDFQWGEIVNRVRGGADWITERSHLVGIIEGFAPDASMADVLNRLVAEKVCTRNGVAYRVVPVADKPETLEV